MAGTFVATIFFSWPLVLVLGVFGSLGILFAKFGVSEPRKKAPEPSG